MRLTTKENQEKIWQARWSDDNSSGGISFLGRLMFAAKKKVLHDIVSSFGIKEVLEVGCGLGHTLAVFRDMGLDASGIDIADTAIEACRNRGLKVKKNALEDEAGCYELVSSDGMLEHYLNFEPLVKQLLRISRRYVLIIQPNHESLTGKTLVYLSELIKGDKNVHEYNYRMADFINMFEHNGATLLESRSVFLNVFRLLLFEQRK